MLSNRCLLFVSGLWAAVAGSWAIAQEAAVIRRVEAAGPVVASTADDDSRSPYADWPDRGMRPPPDLAERRSEIFPDQAAAIAATYADESWRCQDHCRAGWPTCVHRRAHPSDTGRYCAYYVGGGAAWRGEGRYDDEGTWGWDYGGFWLHKRVALRWSHDRCQGGEGAYQTDGPKILHHE